MTLAYPWFLLLALPGALVLWWSLRRSLVSMTPAQRRASLAIRVVALSCLLLALAGLRIRRESDALGVLFLVDGSASISPDASKQARSYVESALAARGGRDVFGVVGFGDRPRVWQPTADTGRLAAEAFPELPANERAATDIGRALDFAAAAVPAGRRARVVLLTDGNDTAGRASEAAARLGATGAELVAVPLRNPSRPEVLASAIEGPRSLKTGQPFDLRVVLESNVATPARLQLYQDGLLLGTRQLTLQPGRNEAVFANLAVSGSFSNFEAEVTPEQDTLLENNRIRLGIASAGEPRVLLVDGDETRARPLAQALRAGNISVELRGPGGLPRSLEELQGYDLFILSDVSALTVSREQMETYRTWVQEFGGGFVMVGGENSFGVGGWFRTPVEQLLPVRMEHDDRQDTPSVALLVTLDRSGSMSAPATGGQTKISLADQGAALSLGVLQPKDYFCMTAVDTKVNVVVPMGKVASLGPKSGVEQKILSITAGGGGIYIYTSLLDAFQRLRDVQAKIKHVILFSDAADAEEKFAGEMADGAKGTGTAVDLVTQMLGAKITTSVVALGFERDKDTNFLRLLAERGNGRFYLTNDALNLPQIFTTETMKVSQSSLVEEPFQPRVTGRSPLLGGVTWAQAPLLLGYNATKPKPTAEILLATESGDPLLATWRYGLGQAAAFTSDAKSRWGGEWLGWPGYGKFWTQLVRAMMRPAEAAGFAVRAEELPGGRLALELDAAKPDGTYRNGLAVSVTMTAPDGATRTVPASAVAPGRYRVEFPLPPANPADDAATAGRSGALLFAFTAPGALERPLVWPWTRPAAREYLKTGADEDALRALVRAAGHGTFDPSPPDVFARPEVRASQWTDLSDILLAIALILLPLDIWLRRRDWKVETSFTVSGSHPVPREMV